MNAKDIFLDALELPEGERASFVRERSGQDESLRARVDELLGAHLGAESILAETGSWMPELRVELLGEEADESLESLEELGALYLRREQLDQALECLRPAHEGRRATLGEDHELTMHVLMNLATTLKNRGDSEEAEELFARIEAWYIEKKGELHEDTLLVINNRAGLLQALERPEEALERYQRLVDLQTEIVGRTHPRTLAALNNLGNAYLGQERYSLAAAVLGRALTIKREVLPPGHPSLLPTLGNLAYLHQKSGELASARAFLDEAIEMATASLDPFAATLVQLRLTRSSVLLDQEEYSLALEDTQAIADAPESVLSESHMLRVIAVDKMSQSLRGLGRLEEAERHGRYAAEHADEAFPPGHGGRGATRIEWGLALMDLSRLAEAEAALLAGWDALDGSSATSQKKRCLAALIELFGHLEQPAEAARWAALLEELEQSLDVSDP